jgi:hypothetical protein
MKKTINNNMLKQISAYKNGSRLLFFNELE